MQTPSILQVNLAASLLCWGSRRGAARVQLKASGLQPSSATLADKQVLHARIREEQAALRKQA